METITTSASWIDQIQSDLSGMAWGWGRLDELEQAAPAVRIEAAALPAKEEKESESSRLRAELAVASFVQQFYAERSVEAGRSLVARADLIGWQAPFISSGDFARFVESEAEYVVYAQGRMFWGIPESAYEARSGSWWIDLDGICLMLGQDPTRRRYRFQVLDGAVNAWIAGSAQTAP